MQVLISRRLLLLATHTLALVILIHQHSNLLIISIFSSVVLINVPIKASKKNSIKISIWVHLSSWFVAAIGLSGGGLGLFIGALCNRQEIGLYCGLLYGVCTGATAIILLWLLFYNPPNPHINVADEVLKKFANASIKQIYFPIFSKVIGLSIFMVFGFLLAGPYSLILSASWGELISRLS